MTRIIITLFLALLTSATVRAQGTVKVNQGADIDAVVNGKRPTPKPEKEVKNNAVEPEHEASSSAKSGSGMKMVLRKIKVPKTTKSATRHKVTSGIHRAKGFRIQVYSGGNTRQARQAAEQAGLKVKAALPTQPVYVHFYCPRWSCRVGNFKTYDSARSTLKAVRKLGYKNAIIIRSTITVRDVTYID